MKRKVDNWLPLTIVFYCADSTKTAVTSRQVLSLEGGMDYIVDPKHQTLSWGLDLIRKECGLAYIGHSCPRAYQLLKSGCAAQAVLVHVQRKRIH